jgi:hypothetical protein
LKRPSDDEDRDRFYFETTDAKGPGPYNLPTKYQVELTFTEAIAADIARVVAVRTALPAESRQEHECDVSDWYERRPPLMNERAHDFHENGIRDWLVK